MLEVEAMTAVSKSEFIMVRRAIPAEVTNGQLRFQESLSDLEGRRVWLVVLDEDELPSKEVPRLTPSPLTVDELEVEQELDFERPFRWEKVKGTVRDVGRLPPTLILPEEVPHE